MYVATQLSDLVASAIERRLQSPESAVSGQNQLTLAPVGRSVIVHAGLGEGTLGIPSEIALGFGEVHGIDRSTATSCLCRRSSDQDRVHEILAVRGPCAGFARTGIPSPCGLPQKLPALDRQPLSCRTLRPDCHRPLVSFLPQWNVRQKSLLKSEAVPLHRQLPPD